MLNVEQLRIGSACHYPALFPFTVAPWKQKIYKMATTTGTPGISSAFYISHPLFCSEVNCILRWAVELSWSQISQLFRGDRFTERAPLNQVKQHSVSFFCFQLHGSWTRHLATLRFVVFLLTHKSTTQS